MGSANRKDPHERKVAVPRIESNRGGLTVRRNRRAFYGRVAKGKIYARRQAGIHRPNMRHLTRACEL
jgi:hypothetical protein